MENILTTKNDDTEAHNIADDIIADYEYSVALNMITELSTEMAMIEKAQIALSNYESNLTTENSQSKISKLYQDLDLREDQLATLTTEDANSFVTKLKEMIKTMMLAISAKFNEIVAKLHRHFAKTKDTVKSLKKYIETECDNDVDMDKLTGSEDDQSIIKEKLGRFVQCSPATLEFVIDFYNSEVSPFSLLTHFKTSIENKAYITPEKFTSFVNFKELQKYHFYLPELSRDRNPMMVLNVTGLTTKVLKHVRNTNTAYGEFVIETHTGDIKNAYTISESDASKWNKANILKVLNAVENFDYNATVKDVTEFNSRIGKTMMSATDVLKEKQEYLNYMVRTYNIFNRATMPLLIELTTSHKEVLTVLAHRVKFLKKK